MRSTQVQIYIDPTLGRSPITRLVYYMEGGISQSVCASLAACIAGAFLAEAIPSDRGGSRLWDEASAMLAQFRSDLSRSTPADPQTPAAAQATASQSPGISQGQGDTNPTLRFTSLLSSRPSIAHVLLAIQADAVSAVGSSSGTTKATGAAGDLSWLCGPRSHALMHGVVDAVWPPGSSNMVRGGRWHIPSYHTQSHTFSPLVSRSEATLMR